MVNEDYRMIWSSFELATGESGCWRIGPIRLWATRAPHEWCISFARFDGQLDHPVGVELPCATPPEGDVTTKRFGYHDPPSSIRLLPATAPRPLVATPIDSLLLPPGEETTLHVSTPVWVQVSLGESATMLIDEASHLPSDTWFGESTRKGELCYSFRARATFDRTALLECTHRALSVVHIQNQAKSVLEIEKVKLPAPNMSLFVTARGDLWTEDVTLVREQDGEVALVELGSGPPTDAADAKLLVGPRTTVRQGVLDRTFGGFMRELRG